MQSQPHRKLSVVLDDAIGGIEGEKISLKMLVESLGVRAYGILLVLLTLPNAIPISGLVGISAITALLMLIFSVQLGLGIDKPWLPEFISKREMEKSMLQNALRIVKPYVQKIEPFVKPRWSIFTNPWVLKILGWMIVAFCLVILIPLPFSNFGPALAVFLIGLGIVEKDGIFILIGVIFGVIYSLVLFWFTIEIIQRILTTLSL